MRFINILLGFMFVGLIHLYAADTESSIDADIASATSIDELTQKMMQADIKYRYKYMNAIKTRLAKMNEAQREEKISQLEKDIQEHRASIQESMREQSEKSQHNGFGSGGMNSGFGRSGAGSGMGGMGDMGGGQGMGGGNGMGGGGHGGGGHF